MLIDASKPNAAHPDAPPVAVISRSLGIQTNNFAEYTGVVLALRRANELDAEEVELVLDSKLVVEQLSGRWKVRHPVIARLANQAQAELRAFKSWKIRHEPRANNRAADALANLALDDPAAAAAAEATSGGHSNPPSAAAVMDVLERVIASGTIRSDRDGALHEVFPVAITPVEGASLREWVLCEKAANTIEVGLGYAVAALFVLDALVAGGATPRHVAIDPNQATRFGDCGLQLLSEAGVRRHVEFLAEPSEIALPRLLAAGRRFDFAVVDGNHRFDGVFVDLVYLGRLVRPGGIIFLDDYHLPAVAKAVAFFTANLGWEIEEASSDDPRHGWAVLRTHAQPPDRPFDHFVDF